MSIYMGIKRSLLVFLLPLLFVLGLVRTARADGEPVEGRDYWIVPNCETGTCVKIAPGININTPRLAEKLNVRPIDIRRDNPLGTIALCHRRGDGYQMGRISKPEDRASDEVWKNCPDPELQYVYILPGQTIKLSGVRHLSYQEEQRIKSALKACTTPACAVENARKLGAAIADTSVDSPTAPPVQAADPVVAALKACTTPACAVDVAKKAGAAIPAGPSEGDQLLARLKECGGNDDACKNMALQDHGVVPINRSDSAQPTATGSIQPTAVQAEIPTWVWYMMAFLGLVGSVFAILYFRKGSADPSVEAQQEMLDSLGEVIRGHEKAIKSLKSDLDAKENLLHQRADEIAKLSRPLTEIKDLLTGAAKKESLPVPQEASTADVLNILTQHFSALARENGELREVSRRHEMAATDALGKLAGQVEANEKMAKDLVGKMEEAQRSRSSVDDGRRNRDRCGELFTRVNDESSKLIAIDNELTEIFGPHQESLKLFEALADAQDPRADEVKAEILALETRIKALASERESLTAQVEPLRQEFTALHEQLTGFKLDELKLYEEAQRDRNDAAKELGEARAIKSLAEAEAEAIQAERQKLEAKSQELVDRELKVTDREAACKRILWPLLNALNLDSSTTMDELKAQGGIEGLVERQAEAYEKLRHAHAELQSRFEELERQVPSADEIGRLESRVSGITAERDRAIARAVTAEGDVELLRLRVAELEPFEIAAKGSLKPTPLPHDLVEAVSAENDPEVVVRLEDYRDEPVPSAVRRQTMTYAQKPIMRPPQPVSVPDANRGSATSVEEFFDMAGLLVQANMPLKVTTLKQVRTLQLLLTELTVEFDFDGIFKNGSSFSQTAVSLIQTRGEDHVRSRLADQRSLLSGIQWFLDACGLAELEAPQTNRAWNPG
jgi:archaellum component FlaC